nr:response regulator [Desulfobacula sp.]
MIPPHASKSLIMIIDDEAENIGFLKDLLDQFGFNLMVASNGDEALGLLTDSLPDIILLDVLMPGLDGFEVCRRIKENQRTRDIPVLFMTAMTDPVNKVTGLELGGADYITKPFQKEEVLARLKTHFVMRQLQLQLQKTRQTLDDEVSFRTRELTKSNEQLKKELIEQKRMEKILKQAQKMEAVSTLSRGIAHDFNNILSIIIGYCDLAAMENPPESSSIGISLEKIHSAAFRAKELVQHLLTFCRETDQEKTHIRITPVLKSVINFMKPDFPSSIELKMDLKEETGTILADTAKIQQLILNLCRNAVQAMAGTGGKLTIGLAPVFLDSDQASDYPNLASGHYARILVRDTGPGMDPEILERIFDPYFTTKEPKEGTGLGLAVAFGIAVSHGGTILVESLPGQGSSFEVLLPLRQTEEDGADTGRDQDLPRGTGHVMLVDDEESLVEFGKIVLERAGYTVEGYTGSMEALEAFKENPQRYDLIVTDHIMPKLQGLDLAGKMLEIRNTVPILLSTGTKSESLIALAKARALSTFFKNPSP